MPKPSPHWTAQNRLFQRQPRVSDPLTLMLGPLEELLGHAARLAPADQEHVAMVYRNGLRLLRLVNALLDFRLEAGRLQATYTTHRCSCFHGGSGQCVPLGRGKPA